MDESGLRSAFKVDASKQTAGLDLSGFDLAGVDLGGIDIDSPAPWGRSTSPPFSPVPRCPTSRGSWAICRTTRCSTRPSSSRWGTFRGQFVQRFLTAWLPAHGEGLRPTGPDFGKKLVEQFAAYAASDGGGRRHAARAGGRGRGQARVGAPGADRARLRGERPRALYGDGASRRGGAGERAASAAIGAQLQEGLGRAMAAMAPHLAQRARREYAERVLGGRLRVCAMRFISTWMPRTWRRSWRATPTRAS